MAGNGRIPRIPPDVRPGQIWRSLDVRKREDGLDTFWYVREIDGACAVCMEAFWMESCWLLVRMNVRRIKIKWFVDQPMGYRLVVEKVVERQP